MRKRRAIGAILFIAAVGTAWLAGRDAGSNGPSPAAPASRREHDETATADPERRAATPPSNLRTKPASAHATASAATTTPAATMRADTAPLPPLDEPFAKHIDELRRRAAKGDAPAACRLGMQLAYCSAIPRMRRIVEEDMARQLGGSAVDAASGQLQRDSLALMEAQCRDVVALDPLEAYRMQLAAARAGIVQAQLQLAVFPPLDEIDVIDHVEIWREWRASAVAGLESALANGDPRAPLDLTRAFGDQPFGPWTPRLAAPDPYRAFVYARLNTMVAERSAKPGQDLSYWVSLEHGELLTDAERERAAREAAWLFQSAYAGLPAEAFAKTQLNGNDFADCEK